MLFRSPPPYLNVERSPCAAWQRPLAALLVVLLLAGCASKTRAPVEDRSATPARPPALVPVPGTAAKGTTAPGGPAAAPDWRPDTYVVKRGDTLYQIALDHGLDYRELAAWNNLENVNVIRVGQALRVRAPGDNAAPAATADGVVTTPLRSVPAVVEAKPLPPGSAPATVAAATSPRTADNALKSTPKALKEPYSEQAVRDVVRVASAAPDPPATIALAQPSQPVAPPPAVSRSEPAVEPARPTAGGEDGDLDWVWPSKGKVVGTFSETANLKGIDIAGNAGQPVVASAPGTVVYAGTGLRGYGKLIIIKHNKTFLSAYAHNREILVKEGQTVAKGQKIAEMGNTDASEVKLHFEIRRLGKPMDPTRYLPPA